MGNLVLQRRPQERIIITDQQSGERISLTLTRIQRDYAAWIGIEASQRFSIAREELLTGKGR